MVTAPSATTRRYALTILLIAALTHFAGLTWPQQAVFDEVTFGKFVNAYCCTGERFFDMHPPHGKLLIAGAAAIGGYDGSFAFDHIGEPFAAQPVFALRFVPALTGTLIPLLFFFLLIELRATPAIALLGGLLVALDNALIAETRILVFDGVLVSSTIAAIVCFLAAQRRGGHLGWLAGAGAMGGLALGTKLTGLAALGLMGVMLIGGLGVVTATRIARLRQSVIIGGVAVVVYVAGWIVHWLLLSHPGTGDAFYPHTGRVLDDFFAAQKTMVQQNLTFDATHPDASKPWTWPLMKVPPYFWQGDGASIYMLGNPIVWWGSALVLAALVLQLVVLRPLGSRTAAPLNTEPRVWSALAGYAITFLPLLPIARVLFMYHYLTPLLFGLAFVLLWLDRSGWGRGGTLRAQPISYFVVLGLAVIGFLLVSPLTYGFSAGGYDEWLAGVVRSWR